MVQIAYICCCFSEKKIKSVEKKEKKEKKKIIQNILTKKTTEGEWFFIPERMHNFSDGEHLYQLFPSQGIPLKPDS